MFSVRKIISLLIIIQLFFSVFGYTGTVCLTQRQIKENYYHPLSTSFINYNYVLNKSQLDTKNQLFANKNEIAVIRIPVSKPMHTSIFDDKENKNILGMFLLMGYGKMRYNVYEKAYYTMDYSITKGGGVSYEIPLEVFDGKFSVYNELGFSIFSAEENLHYGDTVGGDPVNNYYDVNLRFSPNTVFVANTFRYCLTNSEFKYYISIGISQTFVVSSTNTKQTFHTAQGSTREYVDEFVPDPAVYGITVLATTGFSYRNIGFELRFDPGRNYSNKVHYAVYMPSLVGVVHVRFNPGRE